MTSEPFFEEKQFLPVWSKVSMIAGTLLTLYLLEQHFTTYGRKDAVKGWVLISSFLLMLLVTTMLVIARLETNVSDEGINYRFYPFHRQARHIDWQEIRFCYIRRYRPILEYGGWGLRKGIFGRGSAINASGCDGLQIVFNNGKRLLIGTRKPDELKTALTANGYYQPENTNS